MRRVAHLGVWSLVVASVCACGARTELDNVGYDDETDGLGTNTTSSLGTTPTVGTTTTAPPFITPTVTPPTPPVTPPSPTPVDPGPLVPMPTLPVVVPSPCSDLDAPPTLLRLGLPRPQVCGDGILEFNEQCDDANVYSGDGCDTYCTLEVGYVCDEAGSPCISLTVCGDGYVSPPEQCETPGRPGCSLDCTMQTGWVCPTGTECFSKCGDGITVGTEQCDDGNTLLDEGCDASCSFEWDYCLATGNCPAPLGGYCGNGVEEFGENCDEGGATAFCDAQCQLEPSCDANGECYEVCGDGVVGVFEQCDDGNVRQYDGCDGQCVIEAGYSCVVEAVNEPLPEPLPPMGDAGGGGGDPIAVNHGTSACSPICGDAVQQRGEECDPSLHSVCNFDCTLISAYCGNGVVEAYESCDDGRNDGVSVSGCLPGCQQRYCGDGVVQLGEACDMGSNSNVGGYEGCTSTCQLAARCGDGIVQECGYESCDDGDRINRDGCDSMCRLERITF
jgi:cysteine-rich repeat protein